MNISKIIKCQHKIKAGLAVLMDDHPDLMNKTKEMYITNNCIYSDDDDCEKYCKKNNFYDFLQTDYKLSIQNLK